MKNFKKKVGWTENSNVLPQFLHLFQFEQDIHLKGIYTTE